MSHKSMGTYHKPRMKRGWDDISVSAIAYIIGILFAVICFVPFLLVIIYSFTPYDLYLKNHFDFFPSDRKSVV